MLRWSRRMNARVASVIWFTYLSKNELLLRTTLLGIRLCENVDRSIAARGFLALHVLKATQAR